MIEPDTPIDALVREYLINAGYSPGLAEAVVATAKLKREIDFEDEYESTRKPSRYDFTYSAQVSPRNCIISSTHAAG